MTKDEIKKALECCAGNIDWLDCNDCQYFKHHCGRGNKLMQDALNLITEQEQEIEKQNSRVKCLKTRLSNKMVLLANVEDLYESETEKLKADNQELATALKQAEDNYSRAFERLKSQQRDIDILKAENERLAKVVSEKVYDFIDDVKGIADAREAWERQAKIDVLNELKEKCKFDGHTVAVYKNDIDEMIEEIENE